MHVVVRGDEQHKKLFTSKPFPAGNTLSWYAPTDLIQEAEGDVFFDFCYDTEYTSGNIFVKGRLVFANAVITTTKEFKHKNYVRFNGWPSFFEKDIIELACSENEIKHWAEEALSALGWKYIWAPDEPGMITARILAMVINEAYYGLESDISSRAEIDTAMKLGTNYPGGPFEWCDRIGVQKIYHLLEKLAITQPRYTPNNLLKNEALA